jgi:hypothetical protein
MKTKPTKKKISPTKKKPIMIQSEISSKRKPTITIHVAGGYIEDIVKERCNEIDVVVHDYDIQGVDTNDLCTDKQGNQYKVIRF